MANLQVKSISVISYGELIYGANKSVQIASNLAKVHRLQEIFPIIDATKAVVRMLCYIKGAAK